MKTRIYLRITWLGVATLLLAGCRHTARGRLGAAFDPQPAPVLEQLGIAPSTSPRLGMRVSGEISLTAVYGKDSRLGFFMSHNGGDTFMGPIPISKPGARVTAHGESSPTLALGHTQIYVLWQQEDAHGSELLAARSLSWGHSFEKPVKVTDKEKPSSSGFPSIAVAPNGDVYAVWLDGRDRQPPVPGNFDPEGTLSVYIARSTDGGASFGRNIRVALGACPCCRPTLAFGAHGEVYVAWRKVFPGDIRDMVVATSHDHGETFSAPVRVAMDNWKIPGCPDSGPSLAVQGSRLYVAWFSDGGSKPGIRLSYSDNGARTFAKPVIASANVLEPNHPALAVAGDGTVLLAFQGRNPQKREGWSPLAPYVVEVDKSGDVTQPVEEVPGNQGSASYPTVLAGNGSRILIAWTETTDKETQVVLSRGRRTP